MKYILVKEASERWKISERMVRKYCTQKRVDGAYWEDKIWYIPETAVKPAAIVQPEPEMPRFAKRMAYHNQKNYHYGLYEYIQVYLAYSSSRMASNRLTMQQVQEVYRTNKIATTFEPVKVNDLIEILNHFLCVNHIMETIMTPLSANYIKKLHHLLTYGTFSDRKHRTGLGEFRTKDAKPGAPAKQITGQLGELIKNYEKRKADFNGILDFHARFELIHPFEDYNGRVGRVLILKECLRQGVDPFIIDDKRRGAYNRGIAAWEKDTAALTEVALEARKRFQAKMELYRLMQYTPAVQHERRGRYAL